MRRTALLLGLGVGLATAPAHGTDQQQTGVQSVRLAKEVFRLSVEARLVERQGQCRAAIAAPTFCNCINADLPLELNFIRYVALVSADPERLTPDEKALQETAFAVRNRCVSTSPLPTTKR